MAIPAACERTVRRASSLVAYWQDGQLAVENYLSQRQVIIHPSVMQLVSDLEEPRTLADLEQLFADLPDAQQLIASLLEHDILIEKGSELDQRESLLQDWQWGHDAKYFHYATQDVAYTFDFDAIRAHFEQKALADPPPPPFKTIAGEFTELPSPQPLPNTLANVLSERRTCREFSANPLTPSQLSDVLFWTWGKQRYYNQSHLDRRIMRTSPSGGARHPIEVYTIVWNVAEIPAGLYHYSVERHGLTFIDSAPSPEQAVELYSGQAWVAEAACLFIMTAMLPRSMWKYDHSRAYRVVLLDAGHLGQTFHVTCTALGLGPFTTAALQDRAIEKTLQIDGIKEVLVYAAATGLPNSL